MEIVFNHKNCSYCNNFFTEESWCKECDPCRVMEGWTSGNPDIDKFIKDTIRKEYRLEYDTYYDTYSYDFLEWVPFNRFTDIKEIGEGGFAKVYSANWIDGNEIRAAFKEADKEIPNILTSYEKNPDAVYTSRVFNFSNMLSRPVNSSIITSYINEESNEAPDSQLVNLEIPN
ncbi:kinase-like domain-containing protein [Rhizophagus clarus]|uniref:Kinase-like domain-containing protein n=1 Tax=Rhizophagus clarus TaxID=94130 RepID=A0A8H3KV26_9GLOM|nr:kinase-like domain-containing protein [Rhizophagus clarus]